MAEYKTGREIVAAFKKASDWRTALAVGAGDGILILNDGMGAKEPTYIDDDSLGQPDIECTYLTSEAVAGAALNGYLRLEGWDVMLALMLGTAGTPSQESGTAYSNTYSPADSIADLFGTLVVQKANTQRGIWEVPSAKISGFVLEANIGELANITFNYSGNKIETVSPVNTTTEMAAVTYPSGCQAARMDTRFKMRMNDQAGAALADTDKVYPHGFRLTYNRPLSTDEFEASYIDMSEPVQEGFAETTVELMYDKYNIDTFLDAIAGEAQYKMDILFEGAIITGAYRYTMRIDIPKIQWKIGDAPIGGPGKIPMNVTGRMFKVDSAPTGMSGVTDPLSMYIINTRQTDPLA